MPPNNLEQTFQERFNCKIFQSPYQFQVYLYNFGFLVTGISENDNLIITIRMLDYFHNLRLKGNAPVIDQILATINDIYLKMKKDPLSDSRKLHT